MWYMPKPVTVSINLPQPRTTVFDHLDLIANHEAFNDHLMTDWQFSGPPLGVGAAARVRTKAFGVADVVDIEVIETVAPELIVERNTAARARRVGCGTYRLHERADGGTLVEFEYRWLVTPLVDRLTAPLARAFIRRNNSTAMQRLAEQLAACDQG